MFSREEWDRLRLVRQSGSREKIDKKYPAVERREDVLPPQYGDQVDRVRSDDGRRGEDDDLQTLTLAEKTTKVRFLGIPLVEVRKENRWTNAGEEGR